MQAPWRIIDILGVNRLVQSLGWNDGWLLLYGHGVSRAGFELNVTGNHIPVDVFGAHLAHLISLGYRFIGMSEGLERLKRGLSMRGLATLTLDDGFANVVEQAYPVMASLKAKGCIYVVAGCVESNDLLWTDKVALVCWESRGCGARTFKFPAGDEAFDLRDKASTITSIARIKTRLRQMPESLRRVYFEQFEDIFRGIPPERIPQDYRLATWEQLRQLDPNILEVGNHSLSHPNLTNVDIPEQLKQEIVDSKLLIEAALGRRVRHFCYPAGAYDASIIKVVQAAGHESAVSTISGVNSAMLSGFELRRCEMHESPSIFRAKVSGVSDFVHSVRGSRLWKIPWLGSFAAESSELSGIWH